MKNKKINKYNFSEIEKIKNLIRESFPQQMNVGFYIKDFRDSSIADNPKLRATVASGAVLIRGDDASLRIYRHADSGNHLFDVDETEGVNKILKRVKDPQEISNHHLNSSIPEDIMSLNNLTIEVIEDEDGTLRINTDEGGMVKALINFKDPRELK